ncbi:MAG: hypothetical protein S4CHLAM45_11970 [Chlamydiales bacterium]|nr:hypothetical protein [Chlamydiales bacterium]MCH9619686.1 hypothetical protein [Chlamydiales bacterium]MCH9623292.1 hypothetical protein [Chlamydiales bacterium]
MKSDVSYTAEGSFQINEQQNPGSLALSFLSGASVDSSSSYDIELSLTSFPVLKRVVEKLGLQGSLSQIGKRGKKENLYWKNFLIWKTLRHYGESPPSSPLFKVEASSLLCRDLSYTKEGFSTQLAIDFIDETHFEVKDKKHFLGAGELEKPFLFKEGSFTLYGEPQGNYLLQLKPLASVVKSLKKQIDIKKNLNEFKLLPVKYSHADPAFAQLVINTLFEALQAHLEDDAQDHLDQQLAYLNRRQMASLEEFESLLRENKTKRIELIAKGEFPFSAADETLLVQLQSQCQKDQIETLLEMQRLYISAFGESVPLQNIVQTIEEKDLNSTLEDLTIPGAKQLLHAYETQLETLSLNDQQCGNAIEKLGEEETNSAILLPFASVFNLNLSKILEINHKLIDEKNWSATEREGLRKALDLEKRSLINQLEQTRQGILLEEKGCKERIASLEKGLLPLLLRQLYTIEQSLGHLAKQLGDYPDKWEYEQKLSMQKEMQAAAHSQLSHLIESKNITHHLDLLDCHPEQWASLPSFPNSPRFKLWGFVGVLLGSFGMISFICLREVAQGPTASSTNLISANRTVLRTRQKETIYHIANQLEMHPLIFLSSKKPLPFIPDLKTLLEKRGKKVLLIDHFTEEHVEERELKKKGYDCTLLTTMAPANTPLSQKLSHLANLTIFCVTDERAHELSSLPEKTLYLFEEKEAKPPLLSLREVEPTLQRFFSSSLQNFFPSSKT